jgi:hypothetical protein
MTGLLIGGFLVAHGLIHASYLAPAPPATGGPAWPFAMADSWLINRVGMDAGLVRVVGTVLVAEAVLGFAIAGLAVLGVLPVSLFTPAAIGAAIGSAVVLVMFFHRWIVVGFVIDAVVLWAVFAQRWTPAVA